MLSLCLVSAVLAAVLVVGPNPGRRLGTVAASAGPGPGRRRGFGHRRRWALLAGAAVVPVGLTAVGPRAAVVALTGLVVATGTGTVLGEWRRRRRALAARTDVAHACQVLAAELRVGRVPTEALSSAASDCAVLRPAADLQRVGGDPTDIWAGQAAEPGRSGLSELARAWRVATELGAPLSGALEQVATGLAEEQAVRRVVNSELAAPRATGKIMAALPVFGIGLGYLLGGDPLGFLLFGPLGWGCLVAGTTLATAGVLWIETLARRAAEQG